MKDRMIDNRMVKERSKEGINRVTQRKSEMNPKGQGGKMGMGHHSDAGFKRTGASMTPRKA